MPPDDAMGDDSTSASPEQRFLQYARTGNKAIIQALVMEFADRSFSQARRIVGHDDGAEDAIQDAYVRLVSTAKRYDGSIPFAAWLGRLVSAAALNFRRQKKRRVELSDPGEQGAFAMNNLGIQPETSELPEMEALRAALDSLPERYRMPLTLHYFGGLNRNETAQALGASAGTIGSQLFRGLELLRDKLARAGFTATNASLIAAFAALPTYAASAELKASLASKFASSERLSAARREISRRLFSGKRIALFQGAGFAKICASIAVIALAAILLNHDPIRPINNRSAGPLPKPVPADLASGLVAHWTFDEGRGATAGDTSGNGNIGALRNDPAWVSGKKGGALSFDGVDDFVEIPGSPSFNSLRSELTIAAWVFKESTLDKWGTIVGRRHAPEAGPDYLDLWQLSYNYEAKDIYALAITSERRCDLDGPSSAYDLRQWVHLAGVYDGSRLRFYRNGVLEASGPCTGEIPPETTMVTIGGADNGDWGAGDFVNSAIDDVRIYNRALSAVEVSALAR